VTASLPSHSDEVVSPDHDSFNQTLIPFRVSQMKRINQSSINVNLHFHETAVRVLFGPFFRESLSRVVLHPVTTLLNFKMTTLID
jgi:hypothetical protein